ncbi:MAG: cytochrome b5-like heme/steroid binding domain-containing protein [Elusimicrobiota bacterium]|jgi:cytochrome b involved in lipid metabolism
MALKRFMLAMFILFLACVAAIAVLGRLSPPPAAKDAVISAGELARHSSREDCWMAIEGGVYALSAYIPLHPAPEKTMTDWCGKDATEAFATKGRGRPHSRAAHASLPEYRIGALR